MKVIVGLGNPGAQYANTPHSVGFEVVDRIAVTCGGVWEPKRTFKAFMCKVNFAGQPVMLVKPQTFMNLSGEAVAPAAAFYKIPRQRIIVVHDDIALPAGRLRIKRGGSDGGHNGLKSLISNLGGSDFIRVKIGVGQPPHPDYDIIDWVIGHLTDTEAKTITAAAAKAVDAAGEVIKSGVDSAMNIYNGMAGEVK